MATEPTAPAPPSEPAAPANEIDRALAAEIERLAHELADRPKFADQFAQLDWLIGILIARGHLTENHRPMIQRIRARRSLPIVFGRPAHTPDPDIDCASLLHLCHGRCCSFTAALTEEEVRANIIEWDLNEPYKLPKNTETGYCANLGSTGGCTKYHARPGACRKYDCTHDGRVWIDFEKRIPAPMPQGVVPLSEWVEQPPPVDDPELDAWKLPPDDGEK